AHDADPVGGEVSDRVDVIERVAQRHVLQRYVTVVADREGEVDVEAAVVQGGYVRCLGYADERVFLKRDGRRIVVIRRIVVAVGVGVEAVGGVILDGLAAGRGAVSDRNVFVRAGFFGFHADEQFDGRFPVDGQRVGAR